MNSLESSTASEGSESSHALLAELLAHFHAIQNADGGWAFHASGDSRVEPSCWALLALNNLSGASQQPIASGLDFLKSQQLSDGSWPAVTGMTSGGWGTSLAALTLAHFPAHEKPVNAALEWLCDDYPRDSSRWRKFLKS